MRRTAAVLMTTAALVVGFVSPASAATTVVKTLAVDVSTFGTGTFIDSAPCSGAGTEVTGQQTPPHTVVFPSASPAAPSGSTTVAWGQHFSGTQSQPAAWGVTTGGGNAADLGTFTLDVFEGTSGIVMVQTGNQSQHWAGKAAVTGAADGWATINGAATTLAWTQYDSSDVPTGVTASGTVADFAAAHPTFDFFIGLIGFGCDSHDFRFQNLRTGPADAPNVTEFGTLTDNVQIKPSATFIAAGGAASITGSSQYGGGQFATLNSKAANTTTYTNTYRSVSATAVDDLICDNNFICRNHFSAPTVHPLYNTIYKWTYPAANGVDGAVSTYVMVHVQSKINPTFPAAITHGHAFAVTGSTTPAKPGTVISLWATHGTTTTRLGTATIASNGTFRVVGTAAVAGSWALWLTLPNDTLNAASKSVVKGYSVG